MKKVYVISNRFLVLGLFPFELETIVYDDLASAEKALKCYFMKNKTTEGYKEKSSTIERDEERKIKIENVTYSKYLGTVKYIVTIKRYDVRHRE